MRYVKYMSGSQQSPLAQTTPPPVSLARLRELAATSDAPMPPELLETMKTMLLAQGKADAAAELEALYDVTTGLRR